MSLVPVIPFNRLSIKTDLTPPPGNWLRSTPNFPAQFNSALPSSSSGFESFILAGSFPDSIRSVDVISNAENIKRLLKISYDTESPVSMVVHRIGKSLLIDDFDIHRYLFFSPDESEWKCLKKVILETILDLKNDFVYNGALRRRTLAVEERSLVSKFLYRSLSSSIDHLTGTAAREEDDKQDGTTKKETETAHLLPPLPEPVLDETISRTAGTKKKNRFSRNLIWNFEDIRMLIGSDMPIFGDAEHPSVSLRLHNMKNPINILTGLDYWLDNLMCQVPEVLMCYHLDGIVQRYELHKTEDLPTLGSSKFSPKVIRDVAQNILSFLRSNATREGHTYWLFKAKNDDVVKLYDLTSLCDDLKNNEKENKNSNDSSDVDENADDDASKNPFQVAVSMLLYKVARNVMQSDQRKYEVETIRRLLLNCLELLDSSKFPHIATSAHFMLSDIYVPDDINPAFPEFPALDLRKKPQQVAGSGTEISNIDISSLKKASRLNDDDDVIFRHHRKNNNDDHCDVGNGELSSNDVAYRCKASLNHVVRGLKLLDVLLRRHQEEKNKEEKNRERYERDNPKMCKPNNPIPMPYQKESKGDVQVYSKTESSESTLDWYHHLKFVLYKKSYLVYITLAEVYFTDSHYGKSLKCVKRALNCSKLLNSLSTSDVEKNSMSSFLYGVAGDSYMAMVNNWNKIVVFQEEYNSSVEVDIWLSEQIDEEFRDWTIKLPIDIEESMLLAVKCFRLATDSFGKNKDDSTDYVSLIKRLGNVENEIGVFYMNQATNLCQNSELSPPQHVVAMFAESRAYLEKGIEHFQIVKDTANIALLNSNCGRVCRLYAYYVGCPNNEDRTEFTDFEYEQYSKAISYYERALKVLGSRRANPTVWDSISWELSSTLTTMGTLLQDFAPLSSKSKQNVEKQITDYLLRALKYCDLETQGPKLAVYQYRAGLIHHRLASMYHQGYRGDYVQENETRRNHLKQLAELHYNKAETLFLNLEDYGKYLQVLVERVGLAEFSTESTPSLKSLKFVLEMILKTKPAFENFKESYNDESEKVIPLLIQRLRHNLLTLNKVLATKKKAKNKDLSWCKTLYSQSLQLDIEQKDFAQRFVDILNDIRNHMQKLK